MWWLPKFAFPEFVKPQAGAGGEESLGGQHGMHARGGLPGEEEEYGFGESSWWSASSLYTITNALVAVVLALYPMIKKPGEPMSRRMIFLLTTTLVVEAFVTEGDLFNVNGDQSTTSRLLRWAVLAAVILGSQTFPMMAVLVAAALVSIAIGRVLFGNHQGRMLDLVFGLIGALGLLPFKTALVYWQMYIPPAVAFLAAATAAGHVTEGWGVLFAGLTALLVALLTQLRLRQLAERARTERVLDLEADFRKAFRQQNFSGAPTTRDSSMDGAEGAAGGYQALPATEAARAAAGQQPSSDSSTASLLQQCRGDQDQIDRVMFGGGVY